MLSYVIYLYIIDARWAYKVINYKKIYHYKTSR